MPFTELRQQRQAQVSNPVEVWKLHPRNQLKSEKELNVYLGAVLSPQLCKTGTMETWGREAISGLSELGWTGQPEPLEIMAYEVVATQFKLTPSCPYPSRVDKHVGETKEMAWLRAHLRLSVLQLRTSVRTRLLSHPSQSQC